MQSAFINGFDTRNYYNNFTPPTNKRHNDYKRRAFIWQKKAFLIGEKEKKRKGKDLELSLDSFLSLVAI